MKHLLRLVLVTTALALGARADIIVLKDGRRIEGRVIEKTAKVVRVKTSIAELTFARSEVERIIEKKTREEIYEEKLAAARTADDWFELGQWCVAHRWKRRAPRCWEKALELDPDHERAHGALGHVRYEGEWVSLEEKQRREALRLAREKRAQGLVEHDGRWVTPEEKRALEAGLVRYEGRWVEVAELRRLEGWEEFEGVWYPRPQARARSAVRGAEEAAGRSLEARYGSQAVVCGTVSPATLAEIEAGIDRSRAWFDERWGAKPGLKLFGGRPAEVYVFRDSAPYLATVDYLAGRCNFVPPGWAAAVKGVFGFVWNDPIAISSAYQGPRDVEHVVGQSYHQFGHLLVGRLGYRGKLLPPWYDEGVAALTEFRAHGENVVFCRGGFSESEGSSADERRGGLSAELLRDGAWRQVLRDELAAGRVRSFDHLARREFSQVGPLEIAMSIAVLEWLDAREALPAFHRALRKAAPSAPRRVIQDGNQRQRRYDDAFRAAVGSDWREADAAWRSWFLSR